LCASTSVAKIFCDQSACSHCVAASDGRVAAKGDFCGEEYLRGGTTRAGFWASEGPPERKGQAIRFRKNSPDVGAIAMRANSKLVFTVAISMLIGAWMLSGECSRASAQSGAQRPATAAQFGVTLVNHPNGLFVGSASGRLATAGLRAGDEIVAVNGRRVASERAFVGRMTSSGNAGANIVVARNGQTLNISSGVTASARGGQAAKGTATARGGGWLNPNNMVITSDGRIMHKAAAARLGLSGRPLEGATFPNPNTHEQ
jgi:hypothetical protein